MTLRAAGFAAALLALASCTGEPPTDTPPDRPDIPDPDTGDPIGVAEQRVRVRLNENPVAGAIVTQPGVGTQAITGDDGETVIQVDFDVDFEVWLTAAHPLARTEGARLRQPSDNLLVIDLRGYHPTDNVNYVFDDPGSPLRSTTVRMCAHCHKDMNADWYASAHAGSASSAVLADLYLGTSSHGTRAACEAAGGRWVAGLAMGTSEPVEQCHLGPGVAHDLDATCDQAPCGGPIRDRGACADCHAPGIDGALGSRDLLQARGVALESGVHCDVCHKVAEVRPDRPGGVAGALRIHRPLEAGPIIEHGDYRPLHFGPRADVVNQRMGAVAAEHFTQGEFCGACHQQLVAPRVPGASVDAARWPDGRLPLMTTFAEWRDGPSASTETCQSCHMPPDDRLLNAAGLASAELGDRERGWPRPDGSIRRHSFVGPRSPGAAALPAVAQVDIASTIEGGEIVAQVTVRNTGTGHAFPTGESLRNVVLRVAARCGTAPLPATGGHAIPDFGGALAVRTADQGFDTWPGASAGQRVRVVRDTGAFHDAPGWGPFGDGTFAPADKGLPVLELVGSARITAVVGEVVTFDAPLPEGDLAYLVDESGWPAAGAGATTAAGGPGFAFARVTVGPDGARQIPGHGAIDIASDNRLPPGQAFTTTHRFDLDGCADPEIGAQLTWRPYPVALARQKNWDNPERELVRRWERP